MAIVRQVLSLASSTEQQIRMAHQLASEVLAAEMNVTLKDMQVVEGISH